MPIFKSMAASTEPTSTLTPRVVLSDPVMPSSRPPADPEAPPPMWTPPTSPAAPAAGAAGGALGSRDALEQAAGGPGGAAAHVDPPDLPGRHACDLGDHRIL